MDIKSLIAQHVIEAHEGGNWTSNSIKETLQDVSLSAATNVTAASQNTIAAILHHLSYWNRVMIQRIAGIAVEIPDSNGFDVPAITTDQEWKALQEDNIKSAHELASAIRAVDPEDLTSPILPGYSSTYKNLQGTVEHIHYHLGQMTMLKRLNENL